MRVGILTKTAVMAGLWWIIAQGRPDAWLVGLPAVALATVASVRLGGTALPRLSIGGLFGFLALFLRESVRGGIDVARRILAPRLRVNPGFLTYRLRLQDTRARILFINCIGLLPGTLAADYRGDHVVLHVLDVDDNPDPQLLELEQAIARLFRVSLELHR